jgi:hypothetical protein
MRVAILVTILLAASTVSFSQKQFIGFQAGPGFTDIGGDLFADTQTRVGLNIGVTYDYSLTDHISLGAAITYNPRGFRDDFYSGSQQGDTEKTKFNYDYIAIPIKISYSGNSKFYVFNSVGLIPAFLISAKTKIPAMAGSEARTEDVKDQLPAVDIAGMMEIGVGYTLNEQYRIFTSLSGQISLRKFSNEEYFADEIMRHYGFTFAFGVKYALSK